MPSIQQSIQDIVTNPQYHAYLAILKGARNGFVYGVKIRFPHALLMSILFGRGDWPTRLRTIIKLTKQHALALAKFVSLYKALLLLQKRANGGKERSVDTFLAGLVGGYVVFGERSAINEQIVLYVCSRVIASFLPRASPTSPLPSTSPTPVPSRPASPGSSATPSVKPIPPNARHFSLFAALSWGAVMWIFTNHGERIQPGMFSSMRYLYRDSERWNGLRTLLWKNK